MSSTKASDYLTAEEIKQLLERSTARGLFGVATDWAIIVAMLAMVAAWTNGLTILVAIWIIGARQLGLAVLMHDAAHRTLLENRTANDVVGQWLCAWPIWTDIHRYREHHLRHHAHTGGERDPDLSLVRPFPTTKKSLARKFARDLVGYTALKRAFGLLMMDLGYLEYSVSSDVKWTSRDGTGAGQRVKWFVQRTGGVVLSNAALFGVCWLVGAPWLYLIWAAAWMTSFSAVIRIRAIAEHACTTGGPDPLRNTRTVLVRPWERLFVAPHCVGYHIEHHLLMTVPFHRLPRLHRLLAERGAFDSDEVALARGYGEVLEIATSA